MTAQIKVRSLGPNYDPLWGQGQANFITDLQAVAQLLGTRYRLFLAEWWANLADGTPYWQSILGKVPNSQAINLLLIQRALGTPFVTSVSQVNSNFNSSTFQFTFNITVLTQFGAVQVSNFPNPPSQALP